MTATMLDKKKFIRELEDEIERTKRGSKRLSVLAIQLGSPGEFDFGRQAEDALVDLVDAVLMQEKRRIDVAASLGQGRFALILPETGEPGARIVAERLRSAIETDFMERAAAPQLSLGIASFGRHGRSAGALLGSAQRAVIVAKEADRVGA